MRDSITDTVDYVVTVAVIQWLVNAGWDETEIQHVVTHADDAGRASGVTSRPARVSHSDRSSSGKSTAGSRLTKSSSTSRYARHSRASLARLRRPRRGDRQARPTAELPRLPPADL